MSLARQVAACALGVSLATPAAAQVHDLAALEAAQSAANAVPGPRTVPARAQDGPDAGAIQRVISAQIDAFDRGDAEAAFGFAAPSIRAKFGTAARFLAAVRQAYPVLVHPRSVTFTGLQQGDASLVQKVEVVGQDGQGALAAYDMEHEPDGHWRIAGCTLGRSERLEL